MLGRGANRSRHQVCFRFPTLLLGSLPRSVRDWGCLLIILGLAVWSLVVQCSGRPHCVGAALLRASMDAPGLHSDRGQIQSPSQQTRFSYLILGTMILQYINDWMPFVGYYRTQTLPESASLHLSPPCPYPKHGEPSSVDQFLGTINFWPSLYSFTAYLYPTYEKDSADSVLAHLTD